MVEVREGWGWALAEEGGQTCRWVKGKPMALPEVPIKEPERAILCSGDDLRVGGVLLDWLIWAMLFYQALDPRIDLAQRHAGIMTGHGQVGITLNVLPLRLQLVFVPQFIKQFIKRNSVKHSVAF